jgi:haloacetate dehalogenase
MFEGFTRFSFQHHGITLQGRTELHAPWEGPPLLLLHGHPQTHAMWHKVAPELAKRFKLVMMDLRGYGDSSRPDYDDTHANYSKRAMAQDAVAVMQHFGFEKFSILAHDRGARVAHRLAANHPERVQRMMLLDIAPTLSMYEHTSLGFAKA